MTIIIIIIFKLLQYTRVSISILLNVIDMENESQSIDICTLYN